MAVLHVLVCYQYYKGQVTRRIAQMLDSQEPIFFIDLFSTWIAATVYTSKIHNSINCFTDDLLGKGSVMKDWGGFFYRWEWPNFKYINSLINALPESLEFEVKYTV